MNHHFIPIRGKLPVLFILFFSPLFLSGCWDRHELNDLVLVPAAAIDKKSDHTLELSVVVIVPKGDTSQQGAGGGGGTGMQTFVRSGTGKTLAEAVSKLQELLPREIFWGICKVFIIDKELAEDGISSHLDFIMRYPQLREQTKIFISEGKGKDILSLMPPLERDISEVLRELTQLKIGMDVNSKDLAEMLISDSGDLGIPLIRILPSNSGDEKKTIGYISGTAIFKKDKMIGQIDDSVTRGVLWLRNEIKLSMVSLKPPGADGYVSMKLLGGKTKLIPKIENGKWKMTVQVVTEDDIAQNNTNWDAADPQVAKRMQKLLERKIEEKVELALNKVQKEMQADILGFADTFHRKYPKTWKREKYRWDAIFPDVEVSFDVRAYVRRQGMNSVNPDLNYNEGTDR